MNLDHSLEFRRSIQRLDQHSLVSVPTLFTTVASQIGPNNGVSTTMVSMSLTQCGYVWQTVECLDSLDSVEVIVIYDYSANNQLLLIVCIRLHCNHCSTFTLKMLQMGKFTYKYIDRCLGAVCREQNLNNVI